MDKLLLNADGSPMIFRHVGSGKAKARPLTRKERDRFALDIIMGRYRRGGCTAYPYFSLREGYPDFALQYRTRLRKSFIVRSTDSVDIVPDVDRGPALRLYHAYGTFPRLVLVQLNCIETGSSADCIAGGTYTARVRYISLADDNAGKRYDGDEMSQRELAEMLSAAWNRRDVALIEPYIADDVTYESAWVFDTIVGRREYLDNLRDRFEYMSPSVRTEVEQNPVTLEWQLRTISTPVNTLTVHTHGGLITSMKMCEYDITAAMEDAQYGTKGDFI